jgi:hypothetical protein
MKPLEVSMPFLPENSNWGGSDAALEAWFPEAVWAEPFAGYPECLCVSESFGSFFLVWTIVLPGLICRRSSIVNYEQISVPALS